MRLTRQHVRRCRPMSLTSSVCASRTSSRSAACATMCRRRCLQMWTSLRTFPCAQPMWSDCLHRTVRMRSCSPLFASAISHAQQRRARSMLRSLLHLRRELSSLPMKRRMRCSMRARTHFRQSRNLRGQSTHSLMRSWSWTRLSACVQIA